MRGGSSFSGDPAVRLPAVRRSAGAGTDGPILLLPPPASGATSSPSEPQGPGESGWVAPPDRGAEGVIRTAGHSRLARQRLVAAVEQLAGALERAAENVTVVEVATYSSAEVSTARYDPETGGFTDARLRALSRANVTGDLRSLIPERDGAIDTEVWELHVTLLKQAQETRLNLLRSPGSALGGLLDVVRLG